MAQLPAHFLEVLLAVLRKNEPLAQNTGGNIKSNLFVLGRGYERERGWLQNIRELCKEELAKDDAGYCTWQVSLSSYEPAIISLLALFVENAYSIAMIPFTTNVIRSAAKHVNPVQVPWLPLLNPCLHWPNRFNGNCQTHEEDHLVVMFGALHVEMAAFKALGKWLTGSGWTKVLFHA